MSKKRPRTLRRETQRELDKLAEARVKLALLEPGGSPERAIPLDSASQVELRASSLRCLRCDGALALVEHRARHEPAYGSVREVELACRSCGRRRLAYYRVGASVN